MKKILMMWLFVGLSALCLYGDIINDSTLKIHATILPKTALMDYNIETRLKSEKLVIALFYDTAYEKSAALELKHALLNKYRKGIKSIQIRVDIYEYSVLQHTPPQATMYYLFPSNRENIQSAVRAAGEVHALTFSYDPKDLEYGVMLSIKIEKKIKPVVNISALQKEKITFRPVLLKVAEKFYQPHEIIELYDKHSFRYV